jgi:hypothetical protein
MKDKILEMALNFFESSVDYISNQNSKLHELQFSIIHLSSSIELMLKAILVEEHWSLVIDDLKEINKNKFLSGNFKSINVNEALERVSNICGCQIDDKKKRELKKLFNDRNKIIHIGSGLNREHAIAVLIGTYSFIYDFVNDSNLFELESALELRYKEIKDKIQKLDKFITDRLNHIKNDLKTDSVIVRCPNCWQQAVILESDSRSCLFCREKYNKSEFLSAYIESFIASDFFYHPFSTCPSCGEDYAICDDNNSTICLSCGENLLDYRKCIECGELFSEDTNYSICNSCIKDRFDNDRMLPAPDFPEDEEI